MTVLSSPAPLTTCWPHTCPSLSKPDCPQRRGIPPPQENRDLLSSLTPLSPAVPALQRQGLGVTHLPLPITEEQACSRSLSEGLSRAERLLSRTTNERGMQDWPRTLQRPMQNENARLLVQKLRISRWPQGLTQTPQSPGKVDLAWFVLICRSARGVRCPEPTKGHQEPGFSKSLATTGPSLASAGPTVLQQRTCLSSPCPGEVPRR